MTLEEAETLALSTLKQVMEEKVIELTSWSIVAIYICSFHLSPCLILLKTHFAIYQLMDKHCRSSHKASR
jgi:hypothetical protein